MSLKTQELDWMLSYSETGRPSLDPELLLRILRIGRLYGITSKVKLVEEPRMHPWPGAGSPHRGLIRRFRITREQFYLVAAAQHTKRLVRLRCQPTEPWESPLVMSRSREIFSVSPDHDDWGEGYRGRPVCSERI